MFQLNVELTRCTAPSIVYTIYLDEQWVLFQLHRLQHDKNHEILIKEGFEAIYLVYTFGEEKLLCELYSFNFFLQTKTVWNLNLLGGDIHM